MGSLMAGWDSHVLDPKSVKIERNKSFTKEEIEAYWRSKKKTEDDYEYGKDEQFQEGHNNNIYQRSKSLPTKQDWNKMGTSEETSLDKFLMKNAWWKRSNWAFLNEPPVLEGASNTYKSQFHLPNSKTGSAAAD